MCESLSHKVREFSKKYNKVTLLVHGVILTGVRKYLMDVPNLQVVFMAHSLGRFFEDKHSAARTAFEDQGFAAMEQFSQDKIGYVGSYFKEILKNKYHREEEQLTPFLYSIYKESFRLPAAAEKGTNGGQSFLKKYHIPTDKKLIFSWGRCTAQKGFDIMHNIPPMAHLLKSQPLHFPFSPLKSEAITTAMLAAARHSGISITKEVIPSFSLNMAEGIKSILSWWQ